MYLEYYNFSRRPFSKTPDVSMLYESPVHAEALARMEQAVEDRELMMLTGDVGCGKTTLSRALIDRLPESVRPALIINPRLSPNQLLRTIARRLGEDNPRYFKSDLIEQINERLFNCYENGVLPLLIIDEAQTIPTKNTYEEIRLLTNFQLDDLNLIAIIMIGQPELERRLSHHVYESFRQRVGIRFHVGPLQPGEVVTYIKRRLKLAGGNEGLFTKGAVKAINGYSGGTPRWINNICSSALLQGFADDAGRIGEDIIHDVAIDLGIVPASGKGGRQENQRQRQAAG